MLSDQALERLLQYDFRSVLDVGSGPGVHARKMREAGRDVTTVNLEPVADFVGDYNAIPFRKNRFDAVWASHVLEHQRNPGQFLEKIKYELKPGGVFAVTVPPLKHNIVGGHVSLYNAGVLLYQLVLSGFNCRDARVGMYGYNISAILMNGDVCLPKLRMDRGDIEQIAQFFPVEFYQNVWGEFSVNWN